MSLYEILTFAVLTVTAVGIWGLTWTIHRQGGRAVAVGRSINEDLVAHREAVKHAGRELDVAIAQHYQGIMMHKASTADGLYIISRLMTTQMQAEAERYKEQKDMIAKAKAATKEVIGQKGAV